jgi:outer membrane protein assembly factor BamA
LYTGIRKIDFTDKGKNTDAEEVMEEIDAAVAYPPNNALLGSSSIRIPFPFGLWVYNAFVNKKGKLNKFIFNKFAANPVYISRVNPDVRTKVASNLLKEYGFFRGSASYEVIPDPKDSKKASIDYTITLNEPFTYDSIAFVGLRRRLDSLMVEDRAKILIKKGDYFNVNVLAEEQERISTMLRDQGFYYFRPEFITYQADTLMNPGKVALHISMKPNLPRNVIRPWKIGNIKVMMNGYKNESPTDSVHYKDMTIYYEGRLRVRPGVLYERLKLRSGDLFSQTLQENSQTAFARLNTFRYTDMQYAPQDTSRTCRTLDLTINTIYDMPLDGEFEMNVTTKSSDQTGPGAVFGVTRRNIFGGGETFSLTANGSYEWQTGKRVSGNTSKINSWEFGVSSKLTIPHVLLPELAHRDFEYPSSTSFKLYADQLNRAKFFKLLAFGGDMTFDFQTSETRYHSVTPFKLTYSLLQKTTAAFDSITASNPALLQSLDNQFIPQIGYTFTYDNTSISKYKNHFWYQASISEAGNLINGIYTLAGQSYNEKDKRFLGNKFAQFVKTTQEIRYYYKIFGENILAMRLMGGIVYSFGNSNTTPYSEQFYIGGANSIRAFTVRSIGPGSYHPTDTKYGYLDQTGDLKLEGNIEYRFPILGDLRGATFLDTGNIWLLKEDPNRPGGQITAKHFLKQLALGTGVGLRYDLTFLVLRFDVGIGLHVPYDTGKKGYYNIPNFKDGLGYHFAIGYPF